MTRHMALVAMAVAATALAGGCAGGDSAADERSALAAVAAIQRAFVAGDVAAICARMTPAARTQAARFVHGRRDGCERDVREALAIAQPAHVRGTRPPPVATGAEIDDDRATVTVHGPGGPFALPLMRQGGRWRLDSFFGMSRAETSDAAATGPRDALARPGRDEMVRVADARGLECFPVLTDLFPQLDGGCEIGVRGRDMRLVLDTAFGRYDFGECTVSYTLRVDARGGAWATGVDFASPGINDGCADVRACASAEGVRHPWPARIRASGRRLAHDLEICLDTCAGMYAGRLTLPVDRGPRGWRGRADGVAAGRSGFNLYGTVELTPASVRIEAAA